MMTLDEFIARDPDAFPRNSYVDEPGFESLYVRWGRHCIDDEQLICLDIANVTAERTGKGTFKRLIKRLREKQPNTPIYVESVQTERFCKGLLRMGFKYVAKTVPPSFLMR